MRRLRDLRCTSSSQSVLLTALCLVTMVPRSHADAASDARKAIEAGYRQQSAAFSKGDAKSYAAVLTPDYVEVDEKGRKQTGAQVTKAMTSTYQMVKNGKDVVTIKSFALKGNQASLVAVEQVDASAMNPQNKKASTIHAERTVNDTWVLSGKRWLKKMSKTSGEKMLIDGKPLPK